MSHARHGTRTLFIPPSSALSWCHAREAKNSWHLWDYTLSAFEAQIAILRRARHTNIVGFIGSFSTPQSIFIALESCPFFFATASTTSLPVLSMYGVRCAYSLRAGTCQMGICRRCWRIRALSLCPPRASSLQKSYQGSRICTPSVWSQPPLRARMRGFGHVMIGCEWGISGVW
jgi:hypothetical protein